MDKHYTEIVPFELAKKLKKSGYPQDLYTSFAYDDNGKIIEWIGKSTLTAPSYADVLDWLMLQALYVEVRIYHSLDDKLYWSASINRMNAPYHFATGLKKDWFETANLAIEKAIELL